MNPSRLPDKENIAEIESLAPDGRHVDSTALVSFHCVRVDRAGDLDMSWQKKTIGVRYDGSKLLKRNPFTCFAIGATIALASVCTPTEAADLQLPQGPYKYLVVDQEIREVLVEFGRNNHVPINVSTQIEGRLRGRLPVVTAQEFLKRLCQSYGLVWYYDNTTLHVSSESEVRIDTIQLGVIPSAQLLAAVEEQKIADPRFAIRALTNGNSVSVSGPPAYLAQVRRIHGDLVQAHSPRAREEPNGDVPFVRVFRGKS